MGKVLDFGFWSGGVDLGVSWRERHRRRRKKGASSGSWETLGCSQGLDQTAEHAVAADILDGNVEFLTLEGQLLVVGQELESRNKRLAGSPAQPNGFSLSSVLCCGKEGKWEAERDRKGVTLFDGNASKLKINRGSGLAHWNVVLDVRSELIVFVVKRKDSASREGIGRSSDDLIALQIGSVLVLWFGFDV